MNKIRNIRDLMQYLERDNSDYEVIEEPETTGKNKLLQISKQHRNIIVVAGDKL